MKGILVIMGIAPCLEEDIYNFGLLMGVSSLDGCCDYLAVGLDCSDRMLFNIQHACSYHPEDFFLFYERRKRAGGNLDYQTHSHGKGTDPKTGQEFSPDRLWPLVAKHPLSGSSAFLGAQVGVGLGYEKVVLCGCPMQGSNLIDPKKQAYDVFQKGWIQFAPKMFGSKVKSMSGFTKELLGSPDKEWI